MKQPNIVLIFCDDLGYGDLACYGSTLSSTPRLDGMAAEGVRFTDFYVSASVCSPSRASIMTGCYSQRIGLESGVGHGVLFPAEPIGLSPEEPTISSILKSAGYATACIGKWHLGDQREFMPDRHGFDLYYGFPYSNDMHPSHPNNDEHRFPELPLLRIGEMPAESRSAARRGAGAAGFTPRAGETPDVIIEEIEPDQSRLELRYTELACDFIREHADEPFFLYFPHLYVHRPLFAPDEFLPTPRPDTFDGYTDTSAEDYSGEVACLDWSTGRILDTLAELGIDENTLVIFTSDNGSNTMNGGSNAPLRGRKGQFYEGGFRMPCMIRWPEVIPAGSECRRIATTMDLLPTFVEIAIGEAAPREDANAGGEARRAAQSCDGVSLLPLLRDPADAPAVRTEFAYYSGRTLSAVRSGRYKLHCAADELYDLETDIGESTDMAGGMPGMVAELRALADRYREELGDGDLRGSSVRAPGRVDNPKPVVEWAVNAEKP